MMWVTPEELTHVSNLDVQVACGGAEEKVWQKPFLKAGKISWRFGGNHKNFWESLSASMI
jgi:hypothetical protein